MKFEIEILDNVELYKRMMATAAEAALESVGLHLEGESKEELENDPRRVDTSRLKNNITHVVQNGGVYVGVGANVPYAIYVHEGTGRFATSGTGRKDPWWYKDEKGKWHYTAGMKPNRFLVKAVERNRDQIRKFIVKKLEGG